MSCVSCVLPRVLGKKRKETKKHALRFYGPILCEYRHWIWLSKFDFFRRMNFWSNKPKVVTRARKREREKERKKERKKEREDERKKEKSVLEISVFC